ncbi:DedA family protein [Propionicicella superfundia]|uniref:DedA family protein n=1 Tax=Propionicicella superfundia TaxID=348582 RepID=UPI000407F797|nr:VTT domain-containing protein [Propionicicella superfundia]
MIADPRTWPVPYPVVVAALFVIVMLRANATYWLGRAAAAGTERSRAGRLMHAPGYARAVASLNRWGPPVVSFSFLTVGFQTLVNLAAGAMRMSLRRYLPAVTIGCIMWAFLYATVGFAGFGAVALLYQRSPVLAGVVGAVAVGALITYIAVSFRRRVHGSGDDPDRAVPEPTDA